MSESSNEQRGSQAVKGCPVNSMQGDLLPLPTFYIPLDGNTPAQEKQRQLESLLSSHMYSTQLQAPFPAPMSAKGAQHCQGT